MPGYLIALLTLCERSTIYSLRLSLVLKMFQSRWLQLLVATSTKNLDNVIAYTQLVTSIANNLVGLSHS